MKKIILYSYMFLLFSGPANANEAMEHSSDSTFALLQSDEGQKKFQKFGPCLSEVCIGMTIDDVLKQSIEFVDGDIQKSSPDPNSQNMQKIKGLDLKSLTYLSMFYPDEKSSAFLDRKALKILNEAETLCDSFPIQFLFLSENQIPTQVTLWPVGDRLPYRVAHIAREYKYDELQVPELLKQIKKKYEEYKIFTKPYEWDDIAHLNYKKQKRDLTIFPNIIFSTGPKTQVLILVDKELLSSLTGLYFMPTKMKYSFSSAAPPSHIFKEQEGCLTRPSIE